MPPSSRFNQTLTSELSLTRKDLPSPTNPKNIARSTIINLITHSAALTPAHPQQKTDKSWGNAILALVHLHATEEYPSLMNPSMLDHLEPKNSASSQSASVGTFHSEIPTDCEEDLPFSIESPLVHAIFSCLSHREEDDFWLFFLTIIQKIYPRWTG